MDFDFGIIGGGPAGYTAAMNLAGQGNKVILFEKDKLGGTCLNKGCIPTKSLLHSAKIYSEIKNCSEFGCELNTSSFDFMKVLEKKNKTVEKIRKSLELAVKNSGVTVVYQEAEIKDKHSIIADNEEYSVDNIVVACGSKPREIKGLEYDHKFILSSDDILNMAYLPKSVLIIGSGAIGTEWARILHNFGVEVNIVELAEFLVPAADVEISKRLERIYKKNGIKYFLNDMVQRIDAKNVYLKSGTLLQPDFILVAIGRTPVVCKNAVLADVLGDSCGEIQLAHYAIHQAKEYSLKIHFDKTLTPSVIYGEPEIAWVGLREQDVDETYRKVLLPISALGKSWCDDATDGCIKLITKNNLIYGAHIISNEASSLIHILLLAIQKSIPISELKEICYAHPTYAEGIFDILCR